MDLQLTLTLLLLVAAVLYLALRAFRTWFASPKGCAGGCACSGPLPGAGRKQLQDLKLMRRTPEDP